MQLPERNRVSATESISFFYIFRASCVRAPICITYTRIEETGLELFVTRIKLWNIGVLDFRKAEGRYKKETEGERERGGKRIFQKLSRHVRDRGVRSNGQKSEPPLTIGRVFRARNEKEEKEGEGKKRKRNSL